MGFLFIHGIDVHTQPAFAQLQRTGRKAAFGADIMVYGDRCGDCRIGYITNSDAELEYIYGITDIRFPYSGSERAEYIQHMFEAFNAPLCPLEILVQV